jgi:hypothetical protein
VVDIVFCRDTLHSWSRERLGSTTKEPKMSKLIAKYKALPTPTNRAKLQAYIDKHPFAVCLASEEENQFLRVNEFKS